MRQAGAEVVVELPEEFEIMLRFAAFEAMLRDVCRRGPGIAIAA